MGLEISEGFFLMKQFLITFSILSFALCTSGAQAQRKATLAQQRMCYEQAEKVVKGLAMDGYTMDWLAHYNVKRNICYVRTLETRVDNNGNLFVQIVIKDAFENDDVGLFFSTTKDDLKKVIQCRVEGEKCETEDEFI